jgi:hypothetical protein
MKLVKGSIEAKQHMDRIRAMRCKQKGGSIYDTVKTVYTAFVGRKDFSPQMRKLLSRYGNDEILSIKISRNVLSKLITGTLNVISVGEFKKQNPDNLYHLGIFINTSKGKFRLEKLDVITLKKDPTPYNNQEYKEVPMKGKNISINQLLHKAENKMGEQKFFGYDSANNNCQDFVMALLSANGLSNEEIKSFVKQDTSKTFEGLPITEKVAKTVTDIGQVSNVLLNGESIRKRSKKHNY